MTHWYKSGKRHDFRTYSNGYTDSERRLVMNCIHCSAPLSDDALFCSRCGTQQNAPERPVTQSQTIPVSQPATVSGARPSSSQAASPGAQFDWSALTRKQNAGFLTAGIGGIVALFAFFVLPFISVTLGMFGTFSLTGSQLAGYGGQASGSPLGSALQGLQLLWIAPLVALIIIAIAAYQLFMSKPTNAAAAASAAKAAATWLIVLGGIMLLGVFIRYIIDSQPLVQSGYGVSSDSYSGPTVASFYGAGVWIYALSMIAVIVGGCIQLGQKAEAGRVK
jgi:hypothetical protein